MNNLKADNGITTYFNEVQSLAESVFKSQEKLFADIAQAMADVVEAHKRVFIFGTGHSHMMIEEGFYRAGGLTAVVPIFSAALMIHEHPVLSSKLERTGGIAGTLLDQYKPEAGDMIFIYSNSGVNYMPVEMAMIAKEIGLTVVAVCAKEYADKAPLSPIGKKLYEVADYVIDNGGKPGDALVGMKTLPWRVGPSSTAINAMIWNAIVSEASLIMEKTMGEETPVIASLNMAGAAEHNDIVFAAWKDKNPFLG